MKNRSRYLIAGGLVVAITAIMAIKNDGCPFVCGITGNEAVVQETDTADEVAREASADEQLPKLLELGSDKCVPCKMMTPILDELRASYDGVLEVQFIDVWKNTDEAKKYGVRVIPTQLFFDNSGKEIFRHEGFFDKESILAKFAEFGVELEAQAVENKVQEEK